MTFYQALYVNQSRCWSNTIARRFFNINSGRIGLVSYLSAALSIAFSLSTMTVAAGTTHLPAEHQREYSAAIKASQAIQVGNQEKNALVWEVGGQAFCAHTPPPLIENGFQFNDSNRWRRSATNQNILSQGDPMTLTWSFIPDGPQGPGFTCNVAGEVAGAPSNLIAFLDGLHNVQNGGSDLRQRPWFPIFSAAFESWGRLNGIRYIYEPNDDGANAGSGGFSGVRGVRGDLRIGGHRIDGENGSNVLACNFFASNGDMIIDTGNPIFYRPQPPENRAFLNVLLHEHGHGLSISHVCPRNQTKLMEPFISNRFLGPQEDDILAANRGYGDRDEFPSQNDSIASATRLGTIGIDDSVVRTQLSIDGSSDQDYYSFVAPRDSQVTVTMTPTGSTYLEGSQNPIDGSCSAGTNFNSLVENNLGFELRNQDGANLAIGNSRPAGNAERVSNISLNQGAGMYFVRIFGSQDRAQLYDLTVEVSEGPPTVPGNEIEDCNFIINKAANGSVTAVCL